ncbi:hypothetical protein ABOZ73_15815 [Caulobacter sp. 73W]|uniref:Endonuclease n=1 Tax=Caulobacter sp. 73W TaxID=3161137 RepID=A0AB39KQY2_9CAUL
MSGPSIEANRYKALVERIFFGEAFGAYEPGRTTLDFEREDLESAAAELGIKLPKNLGDVVYAIRYRIPMPQSILETQPEGMEWIVEGAGRARYRFCLVRINRILPNRDLITVKIPDATPEIIGAYALNDEQALLAKVRYNRLIDTFLGVTAYSLQNHLRTTVKGVGQIEIDEVYVGVDRNGVHYVVPVQAKGGADQLSVVQAKQDIACCAEKFPDLVCRSVSAQFMDDDRIAIFELTVEDDQVKIVDEKHYKLVPAADIGRDDLAAYRRRR